MKSEIKEVPPIIKEFKLTLSMNQREFELFCRMLKYTHVIPDALAHAETGSGWSTFDRIDLEGLLKELKAQFSRYIFPDTKRTKLSMWPYYSNR